MIEDHLLKIHGMVQVVMFVWCEDRGEWLHTRRGVIYGGRHGEPPMLEQPIEKLETTVLTEVRGGLRALAHRWGTR